jgi:hypothetical protein
MPQGLKRRVFSDAFRSLKVRSPFEGVQQRSASSCASTVHRDS